MALPRESWSSHIGIILAVAGSAIGLGNLLRFPAKVADNGGGAFMIPYFVSLLLLGIPLMWVEWTLGRFGGSHGSGTAPGVFQNLAPRWPFLKYLGVLGLLGPLLIFIYYTYIESWTLAYSFFALTGKLQPITDVAAMQSFLKGFQGLEHNELFQGLFWAYTFFLITFLVNIGVIYFGIRAGIERLCHWALPLLFFCGVILFLRVITLGAPHADHPDWSISNGFGFVWNPDWTALKSARIWLEASGQIFFTLSVGIGVILTYASYLSKKNDVALSGLSSASANEVAEVILGGSIILPAAFVFFGPVEMQSIVQSGIFNLGFVTMPLVLNQLPLSAILGFLWFFLLFLAGLTSSISLALPFVTFLQDEFHMNRKKAVGIIAVSSFLLCQPSIIFLGRGVVDELDFWGGSVCLIVFATIEVILFGWVLGMERGWQEMHEGADIRIPPLFKFIIKYITPAYLLIILSVWAWQDWISVITMKDTDPANQGIILATRLGIVLMFLIMAFLVKIAWQKKSLRSLI